MGAQLSQSPRAHAGAGPLPWLFAVLDHLQIGIGIFDERGTLSFANDSFPDRYKGATDAGDALTQWSFFHLSGAPMKSKVDPCVCIVSEYDPGNAETKQYHQVHAATFRSFADASSNAIVIANPSDGTVGYVNAAARNIWSDGNVCSMLEWEATIHPEDRTAAQGHRSLAQAGRPQRFEYRVVADSGEVVRHVRESCFPIVTGEGKASTIGAIVEDISPPLQIYVIQPEMPGDSLIEDGLRDLAHGMKSFGSTEEFLDVAEILQPGCVIVDVRTAVIETERLLQVLGSRPSDMQVIFIGSPETAASQVVDALKAGASDYLLEPLEPSSLHTALHRACRHLWDWCPRTETRVGELNERLLALPRREREVLLGLVAGETNKVIARSLKLSPRTVEVHRCHLMQRLNVRTLTELLHLAHEAGLRA